MPLFRYKAVDAGGRRISGQLEAGDTSELEARLLHMELELIQSRVAHHQLPRLWSLSGSIQRRELINLCFHLQQLVSAGVPLLDSLIDLRNSLNHSKLRSIIAGLIEAISGGKSLSSALELYPQVFDNVFVHLVRSGEYSGQLGRVLDDIRNDLSWRDEQMVLLRQLLMYPLIVGIVVLLTLVFLMAYLVPQLTAFIQTVGGTLPLHTRLLIGLSAILTEYGLFLLLALAALLLTAPILLRASARFRFMFDGLQLRLFLVGPILRKAILARLTRCFALLYASGITVLECIRVCEGVAGNRVIAAATRRAGDRIAEGDSISTGFAATGLFPPLVLRMLRVGEGSGALDQALQNVSDFYARDVKESTQRLQSLLGPLMTLLLGGVLIWVIVSVIGPIYDLIGNLPL